MPYECTAIFARAPESVLDSAKNRWPGCLARPVTEPFKGVGFASPGSDRCWPLRFGSAADARDNQIAHSMQADLPEWSKHFPDITFVYIEAECFGGNCGYSGYACANGTVLVRAEGEGALAHLVSHLGVRLEDNLHFKPFLRGYFHCCRNSGPLTM